MTRVWTLEEIEAELGTPLPRRQQPIGLILTTSLLAIGIYLAGRRR